MTSIPMKACKKCRWWDPMKKGGVQEALKGKGYCRRGRPTAGPGVNWPITTENDWCGEYHDKNETDRPI